MCLILIAYIIIIIYIYINVQILCLLVLAFIACSFNLEEDLWYWNHFYFICVFYDKLAYLICKKVAEFKGKNIPVDLKCMWYSIHVDKDCWPCICLISQTAGWKLKDIDYILQYI